MQERRVRTVEDVLTNQCADKLAHCGLDTATIDGANHSVEITVRLIPVRRRTKADRCTPPLQA